MAGLLLALLALLAALQWNWIGELSAAERHRMLASLTAGGERFAAELERELAVALVAFHPDAESVGRGPEDWLAERWERWQAQAPRPELVSRLRVLDAAGETRCLSTPSGGFEPCAGPLPRSPSPAAQRWPAILPEIPALALPLAGEGATLFIELDRPTLVEEMLPEIVERSFGDGYGVALQAGSTPWLFYNSEPLWDVENYGQADLRRPLRGPGPMAGAPTAERRARGGLRSRRAHLFDWRHRGEHARERQALERWAGGEGAFTLLVKRRSGSVDDAVARYRRHNLALSLCILGLIGATAVVMTVSAQRAQRLARQQMAFVAGVTHELHTPLTAIRSAGENLADGVVSSPRQVRRYGELVEREGRRLSDMVAQSLELAGIQSGRRVYRREPVAVEALVDGALAASRWLLDQKQVEVERAVEPDLPELAGDAGALEQALRNLIENAVKYGGESWLAVRARRSASGVELEVADRGPGVAKEDLAHLFEPFYRGQAAGRTVAGSGLGLSLVRHVVAAHGGTVTVGPGDGGRGAAFVVRLPVAAS